MTSPVSLRSWNPTRSEHTVLLLHGATSSSRTWWQVAPELGELGYHVLAPDLPGHGQTPAAGQPTTPRAMAARVLAVISGTPIRLVVGHSLGSIVALELFALLSDVAHALILDEPPGVETVQWSTAAEQIRSEQPIARRDPRAHARQLHRALPFWRERDCIIAAEDFAACDLQAVVEAFRAIATGSSHRLAAGLQVKTLAMLGPDEAGEYVFGGDYGSSIRGTDRSRFLGSIPDHRSSLFGVGHVLHRDAPKEWVGHVAAFAETAAPAEHGLARVRA